jgi:hypothetical protein
MQLAPAEDFLNELPLQSITVEKNIILKKKKEVLHSQILLNELFGVSPFVWRWRSFPWIFLSCFNPLLWKKETQDHILTLRLKFLRIR